MVVHSYNYSFPGIVQFIKKYGFKQMKLGKTELVISAQEIYDQLKRANMYDINMAMYECMGPGDSVVAKHPTDFSKLEIRYTLAPIKSDSILGDTKNNDIETESE